MLGEVDADRLLHPAVLDQIVERDTALPVLQAVDHGIAAVVADDDDYLVPGEHARIDVRIHHQVRAVAQHDEGIARRIDQLAEALQRDQCDDDYRRTHRSSRTRKPAVKPGPSALSNMRRLM